MSGACTDVLAARGLQAGQIDLVVPHQANLRIIEAVAKRCGLATEQVFVNVHRYGNMSAATVLFVLRAALDAGVVGPQLMTTLGPGFTAGMLVVQAA